VRFAQLIASVLVAGAVAACSGSGGAGQGDGRSAAVAARSIDEVLAAHTDSLFALPGVVGTAIALCEGERCIKVLLADSSPATRNRIPSRLEGYRVVTEVTGPIRPM
jgi:hypothetical protein